MSQAFELIADAQHALEVKKSRFLAQALCVDSVDAAMQGLERIRAIPATHHCWAYRIGDHYRFSDDGEPSGSAGRPILAAIDHYPLTDLIVVVTRWYGGINLGVGGLVRAYGGSATECLRLAEKRPRVVKTAWVLRCPVSLSRDVHALLERHHAMKENESFEGSDWRLQLRMPDNSVPAFAARLRDLSRGLATLQPMNQESSRP